MDDVGMTPTRTSDVRSKEETPMQIKLTCARNWTSRLCVLAVIAASGTPQSAQGETAVLDDGSLQPVGGSHCPTLPQALVAWWPGNGNAQDAAGTADGTLINGAGYVTGPCGQAFDLTHGFDYVSIAEAAAWDFGPTQSYTIVAWIYRTDASSLQHFYGKRVGCGSDLHLYQNCICPGGYAGGALPTFEWFLVAFTNDECNDVSHIWINDQIYASGNASLPDEQNDGDFRIGTSGECAPFDGHLYNMMIFNTALDQQQMAQLYTGGCDAVCSMTVHPTLSCDPLPAVDSSWGGIKSRHFR
jgi:hypothetical protein